MTNPFTAKEEKEMHRLMWPDEPWHEFEYTEEELDMGKGCIRPFKYPKRCIACDEELFPHPAVMSRHQNLNLLNPGERELKAMLEWCGKEWITVELMPSGEEGREENNGFFFLCILTTCEDALECGRVEEITYEAEGITIELALRNAIWQYLKGEG